MKNVQNISSVKKIFQKEMFLNSLFLGFVFTLTFYFALAMNAPLFAAFDISLIPTSGKVADAFKSGDFSFEIILLFGMHLIKMGGILTGVVYMIMNVYAGILYIIGNDKGESGKTAFFNAFIGFALAVMSWIIVDVFITFFLE